MLELALHVLDIVENSSRAQASFVEINIIEDTAKDVFSLMIRDNGHGMDEATIKKALDPFYTTKDVRRIGLGLPMLEQAAIAADGKFSLQSEPGNGTVINVEFKHSHIDRQPLGDIAGVIYMIILGNPDMDFMYTHEKNGKIYMLDTREIRQKLGELPINNIEVLNLIRDDINEGLKDMEMC